MRRYAARRVVSFAIVLWVVATLAFVLGRAAPGDPAELFYERAFGRPPDAQQLLAVRQEMGLDRAPLTQYFAWLAGIARGDFGRSWSTGQPVTAAVRGALAPTVWLAGAAALLAVAVGVPIGVLAAATPGSLADRVSRGFAVAGTSLPAFVLGYALMLVFGVYWQLLPVFGSGSAAHVVLPAMTLAIPTAATYARVVRASVLTTLGEPFVRAALARGIAWRRVLVRHALPNALLPVVTLTAISVGNLLGGAVIVEWVFSWPGLGRLTIDAVHARDYGLVQALILMAGGVFGVANLGADLVYGWLDPRVTITGGAAA